MGGRDTGCNEDLPAFRRGWRAFFRFQAMVCQIFPCGAYLAPAADHEGGDCVGVVGACVGHQGEVAGVWPIPNQQTLLPSMMFRSSTYSKHNTWVAEQ